MAASRKRRALICLACRAAHPFVLCSGDQAATGLGKDIIQHLSLQPIEAIGCGCANGTYLDCARQSGAMGWGLFRHGLLILVEVPRLAGPPHAVTLLPRHDACAIVSAARVMRPALPAC